MFSFQSSEISEDTLEYLAYVVRESQDAETVRAALGTFWNLCLAKKGRVEFGDLAIEALDVWGERNAVEVVRAAMGILSVGELKAEKVKQLFDRRTEILTRYEEDERVVKLTGHVAVRCATRGISLSSWTRKETPASKQAMSILATR